MLLQLRLATGTDRARDLSRELSRDLHSPPLASLAPLAPLAKLQTRRRVRLTRFLQVKADLLDGSRCEWTDQVRSPLISIDLRTFDEMTAVNGPTRCGCATWAPIAC